MKTRKLIMTLFVLLLLVFMWGQASAASDTFNCGNNLIPMMREYEKAGSDPSKTVVAGMYYMGFVIGVHDAYSQILFHVPKNASQGQICAVVSKYLINHPEKWNQPAWSLIVDALMEAFPIKK